MVVEQKVIHFLVTWVGKKYFAETTPTDNK